MSEATARYHPTLAVLHWLLAALIILALAMGALVLAQEPNGPEKLFGLRAHMMVGGLILFLTIVRIGVRLRTGTPPPPDKARPWLVRLGAGVHLLLYVGIILLAASGIALSVQAGLPEAVFLRRGEVPPDFWIYPARAVHYVVSRAVMALVVLHLAGAFIHHLVLRDGVLARMSFRKGGT